MSVKVFVFWAGQGGLVVAIATANAPSIDSAREIVQTIARQEELKTVTRFPIVENPFTLRGVDPDANEREPDGRSVARSPMGHVATGISAAMIPNRHMRLYEPRPAELPQRRPFPWGAITEPIRPASGSDLPAQENDTRPAFSPRMTPGPQGPAVTSASGSRSLARSGSPSVVGAVGPQAPSVGVGSYVKT